MRDDSDKADMSEQMLTNPKRSRPQKTTGHMYRKPGPESQRARHGRERLRKEQGRETNRGDRGPN